MSEDPIVRSYLTCKEAVAFIKRHRRGRQCFIRSGVFLYTSLPDEEGNGARGYEGMGGNIPVGAKVAMKVVEDMMRGPFQEKGCKVQVSISKHCLFVG